MQHTDREHSEEVDVEVGPHRARLVPPDIVRVWWNGVSQQRDLELLFEYSTRWFGDGDFFVIADFTHLVRIEHGARRHATLHPCVKRVRGLALIGASFHLRVVMTMMQKAAALIRSAPSSFVHFCDDEQAAFAWIESERERARR